MNKVTPALIGIYFSLIPLGASAEVHTISAMGEYTMSDYEEPQIAELRALDYAKRSAAEQAGVYIKSYTRSNSLQVAEDEIKAIATSKIKVISQNVSRNLDAAGNIRIRTEITATVDTSDVDDMLLEEDKVRKGNVAKYQSIQQASELLDRKYAELEKKLSNLTIGLDNREQTLEQERADREFLSVNFTKSASSEKNLQKRLEYATKAISLNPKNDVAYLLYAGTLTEMDKNSAEDTISKHLEIISNNIRITEEINPSQANYEVGSRILDNALVFLQGDKERKKLREKYRIFLNHAISGFPKVPSFYYDRAYLYAPTDDGSLYIISDTTKCQSDTGDIYTLSDMIAVGETLSQGQIEDYIQCLEVSTDELLADDMSISGLAFSNLMLHARNGVSGIDLPRIMSIYDRSIARSPRLLGLYLHKIQIHKTMGDKSQMIAIYKKIIDLGLDRKHNDVFESQIQSLQKGD